METKINWGKGLMIGMSLFMLFIISLAVTIFRQDTDGYDHSYYEKGLDFNADYDREQQVFTDGAKPSVKLGSSTLNIGFTGQVKGKLLFQRPSDEKMDKKMAFQSDPSGKVEIPLAQFARGQWQLIFEWSNNNKQYLYQQEIFVP
jgi:hypothetical protein